MAFNERVVMITGASGNLGRAVAAAFAETSSRLVLVDQIADPRVSTALHEKSHLRLTADLLDGEQVRSVVANALEKFGRIDVLCNIAGTFWMGPSVHETSDSDWNRVFDGNVRGGLNAIRAVVPAMLAIGKGKIVNVAANSAQTGLANMGAYCASKDVVIRLTESMAAELDVNINVNCVLPSILDTPENRSAMPDADFSRWVKPEALAEVILFLASDAARAIHGAAIPVTGRTR